MQVGKGANMSDIPVVGTGSSLAQHLWGTIAGDDRLSTVRGSTSTTAEGRKTGGFPPPVTDAGSDERAPQQPR
ncbi:hypothetical protein GCM10028833_19140 [Glycomyces tarimensis]